MANNIIKRVWNQNKMVNIEDLSGSAFQAESGGHTFEISGIDDTGASVALSGTVAGVFRRADNADIALTGSASGGVVSVTLAAGCYAIPGRFGLTIFVTSGGQKTAVYACVGTVANTSGGAVAGSTPQDVVDLINAISAAVATIPASYTDLMAAIAPTYSTTALYPVGSYVWHDGHLYRCTTPITTAETWTAAHWTAAVFGDDIGDLKSALESLPKRFIKGHTLGANLFDGSWGWEQGNYNNSVNYFVRSPEIPITAGQTYTIGVTDYDPSITISNVICRCFDANGNSLSLTNRSPKAGQKFIAPAGSVYAKVMLNTGAVSTDITPEMVESTYVHVLLIEGVIQDRNYDGNNTCALNPADWTGSHLVNMPWIDNYADYVCESVSIKDIPFEIGGIQSTDGAEVVNNKRIRSADYIYLEKGAYIGLKDSTNYTLLVAKYTTPDASTFIGCKPLDNNPYILDESCYVRIVEGKSTAFDDVSAKYNIVMLKAFSPTNNRVIKATKAREIFAPDVTDYEYTGAVQSVPHPAGNFANVISMWDGLLSTHSNYMTKDEVGYDQSGEYKIYSYTISSNSDVWWANNHEIEGEKNLKLVWIAGIHGNEAYLEYEDYYFFKDLLENHDTNPALKAIWNNIDFVIVPIANPWGYDHNSRVNSRGVNINRNFPFEWTLSGEGTLNYSGPSALSEKETQLISYMIQSNDDAFFVVNRHGTSTFSEAGIFGYTTSRYLSDEEIGRALAKNIDQYMKANFSWVLGDVPSNKNHTVFSWKEDKYSPGAFDPWANSRGYHGILIESGNVLGATPESNLYPNGSVADVQRIDTSVVGKTILAYMLHNKYLLSDKHMWHEIEQ